VSDPVLSALVVLRSAGGREPPAEAITSETVAQDAPEPGAADAVAAFFRGAGFEVSAPVGISFSITAPRSRFEATFDERLEVEGGDRPTEVHTERGLELPRDVLPEDVRRHVRAVTFTPPPDFGPTSFA
jgi:hypothetical protein